MIRPSVPEDWTAQQRALYVACYRYMLANQEAFRPPSLRILTREEWESFAHNCSWLAAELQPGGVNLTIRDQDTRQVIARSPRTLDS